MTLRALRLLPRLIFTTSSRKLAAKFGSRWTDEKLRQRRKVSQELLRAILRSRKRASKAFSVCENPQFGGKLSRKDFGFKAPLLKFGTFLFVWAMLIVFRLAYLMLSSTVKWLSSIVGVYGVQFIIAVVVIVSGFLAFSFKRKYRFWYGMVEIGFGISSAITLAFSATPSEMHLSQWSSFAGCVYVIARGRNNVNDALADPHSSYIGPFSAGRVQEGLKLF